MRRRTVLTAVATTAGLTIASTAFIAAPAGSVEPAAMTVDKGGLEPGGLIVLSTEAGQSRIGFLSQDKIDDMPENDLDAGDDGLDLTDQADIVWHQNITADGECMVVLEQLPDPTDLNKLLEPLLSFDAFNPEAPTADDQFAGFADDSLGSRYTKKGQDSEGKGQACGEVNGQIQALMVSVADGFLIDRVEADIESKFNADTKLEALSESRTVLATQLYNTTGTDSDSSPDSKGIDNDRVVLDLSDTPARALVLTPTVLDATGEENLGSDDIDSVAVGLEGGGDGEPGGVIPAGSDELAQALGMNATLLSVVQADGLLDCGDTDTAAFETTVGGVTYQGEVTVERLSQDDCQPVPYSLDIEDVSADGQTLPNGRDLAVETDFRYPATVGFEALLFVTHPPLDPSNYEDGKPIGLRDWEPGIELYTDYGLGKVEIPWCDWLGGKRAIPPAGEVPGFDGEGSCIFERSENLEPPDPQFPANELENGLVTITEGVYLKWDYRTFR